MRQHETTHGCCVSMKACSGYTIKRLPFFFFFFCKTFFPVRVFLLYNPVFTVHAQEYGSPIFLVLPGDMQNPSLTVYDPFLPCFFPEANLQKKSAHCHMRETSLRKVQAAEDVEKRKKKKKNVPQRTVCKAVVSGLFLTPKIPQLFIKRHV